MIVKACYKSKDFDYFTDKENGLERHYGDIFECSDDLANERIKNKFVKKATKEEEKAYLDSINTNDDEGVVKPLEECTDNELWEIVKNEAIAVTDSVSRDELIDAINKVRTEQLGQSNGGE